MSLQTRQAGSPIGEAGGLGDTFYPFFRRLFDEDGDFVANVETKLAEARMADNVEMFLSRALAVGTIAGTSLWLVGMLLGYLLVATLFADQMPSFLGLGLPRSVLPIIQALKLPFLMVVSGLLFGTIGFAVGFGSLVSIPYFRASAREREINVMLSDAVSFMYALSVGGLNQLDILEAIAEADDTYGEVAKEFQSIVLETTYFDTDYRTAIRNQAIQTPSDELSQFLTDMLSIVDSGGDMTSFLEDQKNKYMRTSKQTQERMLETLELFGEMYMTLSLFPLLLIIILVVMSMMGNASTQLMYITVYGLIPMINVAFLVLVSTVTSDESSDGFLLPDDPKKRAQIEGETDLFSLGLIEQYTDGYNIFDRINDREGTHQVLEILKAPHIFLRDNPPYVLAVTIPITLVALMVAVVVGWAPTSLGGMQSDPLQGTFFWLYMPAYINFIPLSIFHEWNVRYRRSIIGKLSENLRKLSSANETGMTLLESLDIVAQTSSGRLADEFSVMHRKVNYGTNLKQALREFNNKYHVPRLSRIVKLISEAQEASNQIQDVLSTAAQASENQDDIERDRKSRTRMQVVIIIMTFMTLLGVIAMLKVQFFETMAGLSSQASGSSGAMGGQSFGSNMPGNDMLSMLFFHAVSLQAIFSAVIAGYIRNVRIISGLKYAVALMTVSLVVWIAVGG
ncbi:type II secretion system protein [Halorhabdus tiamatea SARL4B]|uniref:Tpye II secretion system, protein F n=1 Tax=Halorhabdus tiamatea SARL4B TaxID=1033806 RepID=F7PIC1_9EURY|nr:type II secretion system F family protein [Halorhabdus tiamatea]ERJ05226.1 type II secretion system protein [Halorhabdus tiamatea SARL4B]CCQ34869.1 tpye II secretion system, protein F [Halorhabdus tiamatea SARL4B]